MTRTVLIIFIQALCVKFVAISLLIVGRNRDRSFPLLALASTGLAVSLLGCASGVSPVQLFPQESSAFRYNPLCDSTFWPPFGIKRSKKVTPVLPTWELPCFFNHLALSHISIKMVRGAASGAVPLTIQLTLILTEPKQN
jgi:hypothetical protein